MIYEEVYEEAFGNSLNSLFYAVYGTSKAISLEEQTERFFDIIHSWLNEKLIKFNPPETPTTGVWNATPDQIVDYFRAVWPYEIKDRKDGNLEIRLYDMPGVLWVTDDGRLIGS